jgi:hypothetical protein
MPTVEGFQKGHCFFTNYLNIFSKILDESLVFSEGRMEEEKSGG